MIEIRLAAFELEDEVDPDGSLARAHAAPVPDESRIVFYLDQGITIMQYAHRIADWLDPDVVTPLADSVKTDGLWVWPAGLSYNVAMRHVPVPDEFVARMKEHHWCPPLALGDEQIEAVLGAFLEVVGGTMVGPGAVPPSPGDDPLD